MKENALLSCDSVRLAQGKTLIPIYPQRQVLLEGVYPD